MVVYLVNVAWICSEKESHGSCKVAQIHVAIFGEKRILVFDTHESTKSKKILRELRRSLQALMGIIHPKGLFFRTPATTKGGNPRLCVVNCFFDVSGIGLSLRKQLILVPCD